ncbi:MAG: TonB-dependent receptor plug domain-containing protein [Bacteroidota bacterium]
MRPLVKVLLLVFSLYLFSAPIQSQNKKVILTGYVKDSNNKAIKDAVLFLDDVKTTLKLNKQGFYRMKIDPTVKKIRLFSYSRGVKDVAYEGQKRIDFVFQNNAVAKNKVETKRKENFQFRNIYEMMRAQVPGVIVNSDNTILIRGITSINASITPLLVVNDAPVSTIGNILPQSVKSITILKGPEAAAYGVRGANGVVIVKTH